MWPNIINILFYECIYKMENKKYHTVGIVPKSNIKIIERGKIDTPNTKIHDRSLSWLGTGTSIKSGGVKLVLWTQTSPLSAMIWSSVFHM